VTVGVLADLAAVAVPAVLAIVAIPAFVVVCILLADLLGRLIGALP
jgi:hypothetical protein